MAKSWKSFFAGLIEHPKRPRRRAKAFALRKGREPKALDADGIFVEIERGKGIFLDLARDPKQGLTVRMWAWPSGLKRHARFIQRACCANLTELGIEVEDAPKPKARKAKS